MSRIYANTIEALKDYKVKKNDPEYKENKKPLALAENMTKKMSTFFFNANES